MEKEKFEIWCLEYLSGDLSRYDMINFETFIVDNPTFRNIFNGIKSSWEGIDDFEIPDPSKKMDDNFYKMLYSDKRYRQKERVPIFLNSLKFLLPKFSPINLAYGMLLLFIGFALGGIFIKDTPKTKSIVMDYKNQNVQEKLILTLLDQPSVNQRLEAISFVDNFDDQNGKVIEALFRTLNNDPNVNVRLAAIKSLMNYVGSPMVRQGLVESIVNQESPIVQITLANIMVGLQERKSIESLKRLLERKDLNPSAKEKIEKSIMIIAST